MSEEVLLWLISLAPSLTAVVTSIACLVAWLKKFRELKKDVKERVEMDEIRQKLEVSISECRELEKVLKEAIEEHTKIRK